MSLHTNNLSLFFNQILFNIFIWMLCCHMVWRRLLYQTWGYITSLYMISYFYRPLSRLILSRKFKNGSEYKTAAHLGVAEGRHLDSTRNLLARYELKKRANTVRNLLDLCRSKHTSSVSPLFYTFVKQKVLDFLFYSSTLPLAGTNFTVQFLSSNRFSLQFEERKLSLFLW